MSSGQLQRNRANFPRMKDRARKRRKPRRGIYFQGHIFCRPVAASGWVSVGGAVRKATENIRNYGETIAQALGKENR